MSTDYEADALTTTPSRRCSYLFASKICKLVYDNIEKYEVRAISAGR